MSADTLRRAAALMRKRAEAAGQSAPSPWFVDGPEITTDDQEPIEPLCVVTGGIHWQEAHAIRSHVASWHPTVALAAAVVLTNEADRAEHDATLIGGRVEVEPAILDFARAYLGESA